MFNTASAIFLNFALGGGYSPAALPPPQLGCANATNTHLEYVTLIAFRPQQWLCERA
jgi:hypothetical protein